MMFLPVIDVLTLRMKASHRLQYLTVPDGEGSPPGMIANTTLKTGNPNITQNIFIHKCTLTQILNIHLLPLPLQGGMPMQAESGTSFAEKIMCPSCIKHILYREYP